MNSSQKDKKELKTLSHKHKTKHITHKHNYIY